MNLNRAIIAGRVSQAPMLRMTQGGQPVATMGVATNRQWTDKLGGKQESVEFHTVIIWGKTAENASAYLQKGSLVLVEGRLETRSWDDKDGVSRKTTEIIAENVQFGARPATASGPAPAEKSTAKRDPKSPEDDITLIPLGDDEPKVEDEEVPF